MVHILTHNDLDGYSAAYVVQQHFGEENCDIEHFNYDREPDFSAIQEGDRVVITDYSFTNAQYRELLEKVGTFGQVIWLDHHITAINRYNDDQELELNGIRSTRFCGAALAYLFFEANVTQSEIDRMTEDQLTEMLPYWLQLVDAWDCWKTNSPVRKDAELLNMALASQLSIPLIDEMVNNPDLIDDYIETGRTYEEFRDSWASHFREKYMFERMLSGHLFNTERDIHIAVLNIGCASSKYFGDVIDDVDVCITECFNGRQWVVSFYSNKEDIDCSYAAKVFGGGGHKGAAGCTFNQQQPPISEGNTEIFRKGENLRWQNLKTKMEKN